MDRQVAPAAFLALAVALVVVPGALAGVTGAQETADCSFPVTATDATGTEVTVADEPGRVVALAPSAAQQLWAVGAQDRVVGMPVTEYTDYLDGRENVTNVVGENGQPIQEEVVGLEPDLVLAPNVIDDDTVESLREADRTVYRFEDARSLSDVYAEIETTGCLVGEAGTAADVSAEMQATVEGIEQAVADGDRPSVYYDLGGGWTAGSNTFIDDLIHTAGGENVAAAAGVEGYTEISQEVVADADPEVLVLHEGAEVPDSPAIRNSTAVREDNVVRVDANYINQPGPRNVEPLRAMATAFHPDAFDDADAGTSTETAAGTATETEPGTNGTDGPGFGIAVGALAVLVAGLVARRR